MGQTSGESRGEKTRTDAGVHADAGWWRQFVYQVRWEIGEQLTAPFIRFVKQDLSGHWFSDASLREVGGYCWTQVGCEDGLSVEERNKAVMGGQKCSVILRGNTRSNVLRRQLEESTTALGGCE